MADSSDFTGSPWGNHSVSLNATAATNGSAFHDPMSPEMNKVINVLLLVVVFITMVSLGCTMEVSRIKRHILRPKGLIIAVVSQYVVMPLVAFCLVQAFQLTEIRAVVVLICGCCPGGNLSNILALALQGDMNLSILMTTCSTLLAFGTMPLLLSIYCRGFDLHAAIPYGEISISLVMTLIPCGIGVLVNYYRPKYAKIITKVGLSFTMIAVVSIIIMTSYTNGGSILTVLSGPLMAISALMPFIGYAFGYFISWPFKLNQSEMRTVSMETGCQNTQLCTTILKLAFPRELVGTLFLFPMVYGFFQGMEAALLILVFRCHQGFTLKKKEKYQTANTEDRLKDASEGDSMTEAPKLTNAATS
ncbi:hepatic sodium/bile acid cotransporter [Gasterosteus aculeatus]|uniref:Hepatic sodium/bile acid cotransporter n=1 Tax=Gasterosteus aculeatus aculeatus TaxID=481459 RepID=G3NYF6_GASAC|nr:sodium/bile acid cotransporter [Gasterosteus aculeatus aculeatus]XP_040015966.1 sodium/bile acid cotransporter [Gasterosteus aculeatus aculeatus]